MDNNPGPPRAPSSIGSQPSQVEPSQPIIIAGMPRHPPPQPLPAVEPIEDHSCPESMGYVVLTLFDPVGNVDRLAGASMPILAAIESQQTLQEQLRGASDAHLELVAECASRYYRRGCVLTNVAYDNRRTAQRPHGTLLAFLRPEPFLQNTNTLQALSQVGVDTNRLQVGIVSPAATETANNAAAASNGRLEGLSIREDPRRGFLRHPSPGFVGYTPRGLRGSSFNRGAAPSRGSGRAGAYISRGTGRGYGHRQENGDTQGLGTEDNVNTEASRTGRHPPRSRGGYDPGDGRGHGHGSPGGYGLGM